MTDARPASASAGASTRAEPVDWRAVFMLPPQRRFTPQELARALPDPPSRTFRLGVLLNALAFAVVLVQLAWLDRSWPSLVLSALLMALLVPLGLKVWADPSGRTARLGLSLLPALIGVSLGLLVATDALPKSDIRGVLMMFAVGFATLWFAMIYRHQYVALRLAEIDERERTVEMARRLAGAQLSPHFLFNTLASVQHWVATKDDRAAPLLADLTGYLRATLPMFDRPSWPVRDELEAAARYLSVMQARLGEARLRWAIDLPPAARSLALPPGVLLTLVENAVGHGIEPQLAGGQLRIEGEADGAGWRLRVVDNGPGPGPGLVDGVGLRNCRERLALLHGHAATLSLSAAPTGGAVAELRLPAAY